MLRSGPRLPRSCHRNPGVEAGAKAADPCLQGGRSWRPTPSPDAALPRSPHHLLGRAPGGSRERTFQPRHRGGRGTVPSPQGGRAPAHLAEPQPLLSRRRLGVTATPARSRLTHRRRRRPGPAPAAASRARPECRGRGAARRPCEPAPPRPPGRRGRGPRGGRAAGRPRDRRPLAPPPPPRTPPPRAGTSSHRTSRLTLSPLTLCPHPAPDRNVLPPPLRHRWVSISCEPPTFQVPGFAAPRPTPACLFPPRPLSPVFALPLLQPF